MSNAQAKARRATLVVIPTYNEANNINQIVARLRAAVPYVDVLIADDSSPDGTGELADTLAAGDPQLQVLHRPGKAGLGAAYLAAFRWGMARGYDVLVEMDADGSHQPEQLPRILEAVDRGADLALGSRWIRGGRVENWPKRRDFLSRAGNRYVGLALGLEQKDATSGFRAYRREALERIDLADVESQGYCFQVDLVRRIVNARMRIDEVPITFVERVRGKSKMSARIVVESLARVSSWGLKRWSARLGMLIRTSRVSHHDQPSGSAVGSSER